MAVIECSRQGGYSFDHGGRMVVCSKLVLYHAGSPDREFGIYEFRHWVQKENMWKPRGWIKLRVLSEIKRTNDVPKKRTAGGHFYHGNTLYLNVPETVAELRRLVDGSDTQTEWADFSMYNVEVAYNVADYGTEPSEWVPVRVSTRRWYEDTPFGKTVRAVRADMELNGVQVPENLAQIMNVYPIKPYGFGGTLVFSNRNEWVMSDELADFKSEEAPLTYNEAIRLLGTGQVYRSYRYSDDTKVVLMCNRDVHEREDRVMLWMLKQLGR